jgi:inosine-uridine nucleoside N-ribohydrolase
MTKVWIDTDIGDDIDDAVALLCAARHPQLELVGVSTVYGWVRTRAWLAKELLARSALDVPVLPGATRPLTGQQVSGEPGSYNVLAPELPQLSPADDDARIDAIAAAMRGAAPFHLVTIGAMTNAGKLCQRHPAVAASWLGVTCMAGRLEGDAEWNVHCDPPAAQIVCRRLAPTLIGLEACSDTLPRPEVERLLDPSDPASAFLLDCYRAYRGSREEAPLTLFDPISLLSLVMPEAFNLQPVRVAVEAEGRLRLTDDGHPVTYALSSRWEQIRPVIEGVLRGDPART